MKKQLEAVDAIHVAVAFGELGKARESANWLAKSAMTGQVADSWAADVSAVKASAEKVSAGKKLGDIGEGLGAVLAACGSCHQSLGLTLVAESNAATREAGTKQMRQHTFAMTLLEQGLLLPSEDLWEQGAVMLEAGSFELSADPPTALDAKESDAIAAELIALGSEAAAAQSLASKGRLYGQMMSRCAACHDRSRQGDRP